MHTSALSRPRNRLFTAVLAALLAVPLLVVTAPPAAADDPTYTMGWTNVDQDATWAGVDTVTLASWSTEATLVRTITNGDDPLEDVWDAVSLVSGTTAALDCEDFPEEIAVQAVAEATCTVDADFDALDTILEFEGTLNYDSTTGPTATATALRMVAGEVTIQGGLPIEAEVGDHVEVDFEFTNVGSAPIEIGPVRMYDSGASYMDGSCVDDSDQPLWQYGPIATGETATATCEFGPMQQNTESRLVVQSTSVLPPPRGIAPDIVGVVEVLLDDPSVAISATADPDTLMNGGAADVEVSVENTSDIVFDLLRMSVATDDGEVCTEEVTDPFDGGDTWELGAVCSVEPAPGDATTVTVELDYETGDGTQTHAPDAVVVDLTSESTSLSVDARYGVINETLDTPAFVQRPVLPLSPDPNYHLGGPAVLEVTVTNDGTIDLDAVEVSTDLAGCADRTVELDEGESTTFLCDGPTPADGTTAVTTVTASAEAEGSTIQANDEAELTYFGVELGVDVDASWDGVDVEIPFQFTIANVGALPLHVQGAAWQVFSDQYGYWIDPPADTCSFESNDPLSAGDSAIGAGCTLLAGDLVDGLSIRAHGADWGESPSSYDEVELEFDPSGLVTGIAELNGKAFGGVEVELRLLDLLELPRAEEGADPAPNSGGNGGADGCEAVGELTDADVGDIVASVTSDEDGAFCFDDVPPGTYEIVVDTDVDADLDEVVVDGAEGFTTNSPATSEEFFVGFASAALENPIEAVLSFSADDPEPVAVDLDEDDDELAATGGSTRQLSIIALLALLAGAAIFTATSRLRRPATQAIDPDRSS